MAKSRRLRERVSSEDELSVTHPNAGGIDIGAKQVYVAVPPDRAESPVRSFGTMTTDLKRVADWLEECGVDTVAMEATGVYWVPLYEILDGRGIIVNLVNAHHVKTVPGRKSDVLDCQWLLRLHRFGLLRASFRPTAEIVELRQYMRQHHLHVRAAGTQIQRIQKALTLMNLQLHNVITDVTGQTGMAILRAIVAGERDPSVLARHRDYRCHATESEIAGALTGNYRPEHLFALRQALELYDLYERLQKDCEREAAAILDRINAKLEAPLPAAPSGKRKRRTKRTASVDFRAPLHMLTGVDLTAIPGFSDYSAATLISEIGTDMTRWPTSKHFTSWLRLTPRTTITGGKHKDRRKLPTTNRASAIFRTAAVCAARTRTVLGARHRRFASRPGREMHAIAATAHTLARIVYRMLKDRVPYEEPDLREWQGRERNRAISQLRRRAKELGLQLVDGAPTE